MTGIQQTGENPNQFHMRADNAALRLRQDLQKKGADIPDSGAVPVGPDGQPPQPLPPEGSYARQAVEAQRQQALMELQQQGALQQPTSGYIQQVPQQAQQLPPQQPLPQVNPQEPAQDNLSPKANERISELSNKLRQKDQEYQQALTKAEEAAKSGEELQQKFEHLQQQHQQMMEANLENLDPETRLAVLQNSQIQNAVSSIEQKIMSQIAPAINSLQEQNVQTELMRLSQKYAAFDMSEHGPLIDIFRKSNPNCTIEQAYRAVVEDPSELTLRNSAPMNAVPPTVPPGSGPTSRYSMPETPPPSDPQQELVEEAQRIRKLRESMDPKEQREGLRLAHRNIAARLGGQLPGR